MSLIRSWKWGKWYSYLVKSLDKLSIKTCKSDKNLILALKTSQNARKIKKHNDLVVEMTISMPEHSFFSSFIYQKVLRAIYQKPSIKNYLLKIIYWKSFTKGYLFKVIH